MITVMKIWPCCPADTSPCSKLAHLRGPACAATPAKTPAPGRRQLYLLAAVLLTCAAIGNAQPWSPILSASRATDWSTAGIPGGITPKTTICATLNPGATAAQINSAISSCASGQVVFLNAGTYNLTTGITFGGKSNVTLRGAGADKTRLVFTGNVNCRGFGASICVASNNNPVMPTPSSTANWTAGYSKGSTVITLSNVSGISPGTVLILDQNDDAADTGNVFVCSAINVCAGEGGNAYGRTGRAQQQLVKVVSVSGSNVTITPGLYMPNWSSSKSPGASWASGGTSNSGIENLTMDHTNSGGQSGVVFLYVSNCWMRGVRSVNANRNHIWLYQTTGSVVRDSYFYGTQNSASQSYGIEAFSTSANLAENNIFQHVTGPITINGADSGSVWSYNYAIDDYYAPSSNWMIPSVIAHESGIAMDLIEGNDGLGFEGDDIHGTHNFLTGFRNYLYGDTYNNPAKSNNTSVVHFWSYSRYFNMIGNVLGRSPYYGTYEIDNTDSPTVIFSLGESPGSPVPSDPLVSATLMRWGNYDNVTGSARFVSAEVPTGLSLYANTLPPSQSLPSSFYLSSKPAWWGSTIPFPAVGPDITGGPGLGGHANYIPARTCYNNTTIDTSFSSANVHHFDADTCYGTQQQGGGSGSGINPPTALTLSIN